MLWRFANAASARQSAPYIKVLGFQLVGDVLIGRRQADVDTAMFTRDPGLAIASERSCSVRRIVETSLPAL